MFNALDFRENLLHGHSHPVFDLHRAGPGKRDKDVGKGNVDLRLFFSRCHEDGKHAQQEACKRQKRGYL